MISSFPVSPLPVCLFFCSFPVSPLPVCLVFKFCPPKTLKVLTCLRWEIFNLLYLFLITMQPNECWVQLKGVTEGKYTSSPFYSFQDVKENLERVHVHSKGNDQVRGVQATVVDGCLYFGQSLTTNPALLHKLLLVELHAKFILNICTWSEISNYFVGVFWIRKKM